MGVRADGSEQRGRLARDIDQGGDLPAFQPFQRRCLVVVDELCRNAQGIEHDGRRHRRSAALQVDVHRLMCQVLDPVDVGVGEEVDLFVIQLGDVLDRLLDAGEQAFAPEIR